MINWKNLYNIFIEKYKSQTLLEGVVYYKHHIIPRHIGGDNSNNNLVKLTLRQHTLAHYLLWKGWGRLEDKVAWLMLSGQTEEGLVERQKLAILRSNQSSKSKTLKLKFKDPEWVRARSKKTLETIYSNNNGKRHSPEGIERKSNYMKNREITQEFRDKISQARYDEFENLSDEEKEQRFSHLKGENHPMYGSKRPGEKAGNFGKYKGYYILITPEGNTETYKGIKDFIKNRFSEITIRNFTNKGKITPEMARSKKLWGYEIKFIEK